MSLAEYVSESAGVVRATVIAQTPVFPEKGVAFTMIHLEVREWIVGEVGATSESKQLDVMVAGARDATRWVRVSGSPNFKDGEQVLLFLWRDPARQRLAITGWEQGVYRISTDGARVAGLHAGRGEALTTFTTRVEAEARAQGRVIGGAR